MPGNEVRSEIVEDLSKGNAGTLEKKMGTVKMPISGISWLPGKSKSSNWEITFCI